jgi:hypothetical protein
MAFQSVPDCAEAVVNGSVGVVEYNNILNFTFVGGGYDQSDINALAAAVDGWYSTEVLPLLSVSYDYNFTRVRGLEDENDREGLNSSGAGAGSVTGLISAANAALVITHRTGFTGRSARGRSYVGGLAASEQGGAAIWNSTVAGALATAFNDLRAAVVSAGWSFVVVSRFTGGAPRTVGTFFPVTVSEARNIDMDSQRGRLLPGH